MVEVVAPFYLMITIGISAPGITPPSVVPQQTLAICEANMQKLEQHFMQLNINSSILCIKGRD
jgi:hypothetical protein